LDRGEFGAKDEGCGGSVKDFKFRELVDDSDVIFVGYVEFGGEVVVKGWCGVDCSVVGESD